jgi:hypothetical protein
MPFLSLHIDWMLLLSGVATVAIPTALLLYSVKRMRDMSGPHLELEPQHLVNIVLSFPTSEESLQSLEFLVRRADFRSPETRRGELRKLKAWLADQDLAAGDGYSTIVRQPVDSSSGVAGPAAERLAEAQIRKLEAPNSGQRMSAPWCVLGLVAAIAAPIAEKIPQGNGASTACQSQDALNTAADSLTAMDAFYLFYAPAPSEYLTAEDARRLIPELRAILPQTL